MNRTALLPRVRAPALLVAAPRPATSGMIILNNASPDARLHARGPQPGDFTSHGLIDIERRSGYVMTPLIQSKITALPATSCAHDLTARERDVDFSSSASPVPRLVTLPDQA